MKTPESQDPRDPDRLLSRGLRATTPEFEARFDELRRRLANEPRPQSWLDGLPGGLRRRPGWLVGASAAALAVAVLVLATRSRRGDGASPDDAGWYAEVVALDDALRGALVLTDAEIAETLSWMPLDTPGGGS